jgi:hypothetical protein
MTTNLPAYLTKAISAANKVDGSHKAHHRALIALIVGVYQLPESEQFEMLSLYTANRVEKSPDSLCTKATFAWFEEHFGIHVTKKGVAKKGRTWEGKGITETTKKAADAMPWAMLVKELAFKMPTALSMTAVASQAAKRQHAGGKLPTKDELYTAFMADVAAAKKNAKYLEWAAEFDTKLAAGEIDEADLAKATA